MIRFLEFAAAFLLLFVFLKFARQAFRRTPPDDRISDEDTLVGVKSSDLKKSKSGSSKSKPPKDRY